MSQQADTFLEEAKRAREHAHSADESLKAEWLRMAEMWENLATAWRRDHPSTDGN